MLLCTVPWLPPVAAIGPQNFVFTSVQGVLSNNTVAPFHLDEHGSVTDSSCVGTARAQRTAAVQSRYTAKPLYFPRVSTTHQRHGPAFVTYQAAVRHLHAALRHRVYLCILRHSLLTTPEAPAECQCQPGGTTRPSLSHLRTATCGRNLQHSSSAEVKVSAVPGEQQLVQVAVRRLVRAAVPLCLAAPALRLWGEHAGSVLSLIHISEPTRPY